MTVEGPHAPAPDAASGPRIPQSVEASLKWAALCALIVILVHFQVAGFDFVSYDDDLNLSKNPLIVPFSVSGIARFWTGPYEHIYIPLTYTAWALLAGLSQGLFNGRMEPALFHTVNLGLHVLNTLLVFAVVAAVIRRQPGARSDRIGPAAALAALLFGLHPAQVEPLAWATGFKGLCAGFFALSALWCYIRGVCPEPGRSSPDRACAVLAPVLFAAALLSKPTTVGLPLALFAVSFGFLGLNFRQSLSSVAVFFLPAILAAVTARIMMPPLTRGESIGPAARIQIVLHTLYFYAGRMILPAGLAPIYALTPDRVAGSFRVLCAGFFWICVTGLAALARSRKFLACLLIFLFPVLPVSGLLSFEFMRISTVADRYMYLSLLGPALFIGTALAGTKRFRPAATAQAALLAVLGMTALVQAGYWKDTATLMGRSLFLYPSSYTANVNMGVGLVHKGEYRQALTHYYEALRQRPKSAKALYNIGIAYAFLQDEKRLTATVDRLRALEPDKAGLLKERGEVVLKFASERRRGKTPPSDAAEP